MSELTDIDAGYETEPECRATIRVKMPRLPNFLILDLPKHVDLPDAKIDVADVPDSQLEQIGLAWTKALKAHAQKRRDGREASGE